MTVKVAVVHIKNDYTTAMREAIELIGGITDLNAPNREVTIKVGVFDARSGQHSSPDVVQAIIDAFDLAPRIYLAESDTYNGKALDRLKTCYHELYSERVIPASLSDDPQARDCMIAGEEMSLGHLLFKPNVLISAHVLRTFKMGSILKNLFGCTPMVEKERFHKKEIFSRLQADIFETVGGFDLAVMDASQLYYVATEKSVPANAIIVGRDAVAVETVGAVIAGLKTEDVALIQEFMKRGLGEGRMDNIEIVGIKPEELAELKNAPIELRKLVGDSYQCQLIEEPAQPALTIRTQVAGQNMSQIIGQAYGAITQYAGELGASPVGAPFVAYHNMDMQNMDIEIGFPFAQTLEGKGDIQASEIPGGKSAACLHIGPYDQIEKAYVELHQWMLMNDYEATGVSYEFYLNDPQTTPPDMLETQLVRPLK